MNAMSCSGGMGRQRGFTLIEIMVVLIIGIVIIAVAAGGIGRAFASSEATTETRNINELMGSVQTLKGSDGYNSVSMELLSKVDGIPTSLTNYKTGVDVKNTWSGAVTVAGDDNSFTISYAAVPQAPCIQIATKVAEAGALAVSVGSTTVTNGATAQTGCSVDTAAGNAMTFTYGNKA